MSAYYQDFMLAVDRSRRFDFDVPRGTLESGQWLNAQGIEVLSRVMAAVFESTSPLDVAADANRWHAHLAPIISDALRCDVFPTLGYVEVPGIAGVCVHDEPMLKRALSTGEPLPVHSWLTLPSMEIIDVALLSKIGEASGSEELTGQIVSGHPDQLQGLCYAPTLVGWDYIAKRETA